MIRVGFDTETFPIRPARQAPRVVCTQTRAGGIEPREPGLDRLERLLADPDVLIVGHNTAFDAMASIATRPRLLRPWFEAYSADRVTCTLVREKIIRIAQGTSDRYQTHGLVECLDRYRIKHDFKEGDKTGPVRVAFAHLDGIPPEQWPEEARRYALADLAVEDLYDAQAAFGGDPAAIAEVLADQFRQSRKDLWLQIQSAAGMRTDPAAVEALGLKTETEHAEARAALAAAGIVRSNGSKNTKIAAARMRAVCASRGLTVPLTKTGIRRVREEGLDRAEAVAEYTALDADACKATGDDLLIRYARYTSIGTLRGRVDRLRAAGNTPIQPRFDGLKKTGRTSASMGENTPGKPLNAYGDQTQNPHREPGLRECYRARPGYVLISSDWSAAELHSLAQVCIWLGLRSELARVLNEGRDPHLHFACKVNGWSYEWALANKSDPKVKAARQASKAYNFGLPGGLGVEKFRLFAARTYGVVLDDRQAREGKQAWLDTYPEMVGYFQHITELLDLDRPLIHFRSGRWRGDLRYTSAANSYFQGHTADMAGDAGWRLARAYLGIDRSVLAAARPWNFAHDEFLAEAPASIGHECAMEIRDLMEKAGREWCPDVPVHAEPAISISWRKAAEPFYLDGRLAPWEYRPLNDREREGIRSALARGADPRHVSWTFGIEVERVQAEAACQVYVHPHISKGAEGV